MNLRAAFSVFPRGGIDLTVIQGILLDSPEMWLSFDILQGQICMTAGRLEAIKVFLPMLEIIITVPH